MFQLPAYVSLLLDVCLVAVYFNDPTVLGEDEVKPFDNPLDPLRSYLLMTIFAACRIVMFLPYIWSFQQDRRLRMPSLPYVWHLANIILVAIKSIDNLIVNEQNGFQWLFLLFAAASILCQCIGLNHLKSTAIPEREVVLGISTASPEDADGARAALLNPDGCPNSERQYSSDLLVSVKKRVETAHERWNQSVSKFNQYVGIFNQDEFGPVFKHVVDLFRGTANNEEPVIALQQHFTDHIHELEFYIPQITIFLLYGSFYNSESLRQFMFDLCSHSATMAHKIRWFVISFCLSGAGVGSVGVNTLNQFLASVEKFGETSARQLLALGASSQSHISPQGDVRSDKSSTIGDNQTMVSVPLSFRISVDGAVSVNDCKEKEYPMYRTLEIIHQPTNSLYSVNAFSPTVSFWDELVQISRELCPLSRDVRTSTLQNKLASFKNRYLPSASIFAPVGRTQHRVYNIQVDESFAFSTRERAPIFVCLEVVDYSIQSKTTDDSSSKKWWIVPELGIKKSIKRAIDNFGDNPTNQHCPEKSKTEDLCDIEKGNLEYSSIKPVLGDRVLSAPLLSDLIRPDETNIRKEFFSRNLSSEPSDDLGLNWEEQEGEIEVSGDRLKKVGNRARTQSLPTREVSEDEVGQWALPSIPKSIFDKMPHEQTKAGFKQGLTRWLSEASSSLARHVNPSVDPESDREYEKIGDDPRFGAYNDVDVHVNSASMRAKISNSDSDSKPTSADRSEESVGYGSVKQQSARFNERSVSADARVPEGKHLNKLPIKIEIEDEIEDPRTSSIEEVNNRLGQYHPNPTSTGEASVGSSITSGANQPLVVFKEPWEIKERRVRKKSAVGHLPGWRLFPVIIKSGDDLRQEQVVSQLMFQIYFILQTRKVGCWLRPYGIIATSPDSGIIEAIPDTVSLDVLRRRVPVYTSLIDFYERFYGDRNSELFLAARDNFVKSLAGYSIICYILQLKDRHNGNILLDNKGHLMHIDFGFVLGITPGGNMGFEKAPFKLTREMIELMDGTQSAAFRKYREICVKTFMALRKEHHRIVLLLEMLSRGSSHLPCFQGNPQATLESLKERFCTDLNDNAAIERVHDLINVAANNWTTTCYDRYQRCCTGVF